MYAIYGNMDPINIPQMLAYIPYMDPMGYICEFGVSRNSDSSKTTTKTIWKMGPWDHRSVEFTALLGTSELWHQR